MMRTKEVMCALLLLVLATATTSTVIASNQQNNAKWTLMIYMASDNNLDFCAIRDLEGMLEIENTHLLNCIVLYDSLDGPAYLYRVIDGTLENLIDPELSGVEVNMGDQYILKKFVQFSMVNFEADHYALILWDHGYGFEGSMSDWTDNDRLTIQETIDALSDFHLDILAFDACTMAMVDVVYEFYAQELGIDYFIGSENLEPWWGYPYGDILAALVDDPDMAPSAFAKFLADEFIEFHETFRPGHENMIMVTLTVVDMSKMDEVNATLTPFLDALKEEMDDNRKVITEAKGEAMIPYGLHSYGYLDLITFVKAIIESPEATPSLKSASSALYEALVDAVYVSNTHPMESTGMEGLYAFFPPSYHAFLSNPLYDSDVYEGLNLKFASQWLPILYTYWNDYHGGGTGPKR